nr:hypothetical transcript [Hymenolepis microstoma]
MARGSRSSKSSKTPKIPTKSKTEPSAEERPTESRRKSLRSGSKAPSSTSAKTPLDLVPKTPVTTRSTRKRLSVSNDDQEVQKVVSHQIEAGAKRRRTGAITSPSPESAPKTISSASARKRRGVQLESPTNLISPSPASKRAKVTSSTPAASTLVPSTTPKTRSTTVIKRRHQQKFFSESEASHSEREEDKKSTPSQSSIGSTQQKRGAKRSRKTSVKSPSHAVETKKPVASTKKKPTPLRSQLAKAKNEEIVMEVNPDSENGNKEKEKSPVKRELTKVNKHEPIKSPLTKKETETLQRKLLFSRLVHDDLSDIINISDLLAKWPEAELRNPVADSPALQVIPASHRLWVSGETNPLIVNGDSYDSPVALDTKESAELEAPKAKRARRNISPENNGGVSGELEQDKVSAVDMISEIEQRQRLLDTFCVASFTISQNKKE